jgi:glutaredoxin
MMNRPLLLSGKQAAAALLLGLLAVAGAQAQTVYRIVGPDGKVTFSDKPPASAKDKATVAGPGGASSAANAALPYELRQIAGKYPVTLYTGDNCGPCGAGRAMLTNRGIPFVERTVSSPEDTQALQRLSGDASLPLLTIGGQQLKGYSDAEWTQFLDAAGYPKTTALPASYRNGPATPLVAVQAPAAAPANAAAQARNTTPTQQAPAPARNASNPAGITF